MCISCRLRQIKMKILTLTLVKGRHKRKPTFGGRVGEPRTLTLTFAVILRLVCVCVLTPEILAMKVNT